MSVSVIVSVKSLTLTKSRSNSSGNETLKWPRVISLPRTQGIRFCHVVSPVTSAVTLQPQSTVVGERE